MLCQAKRGFTVLLIWCSWSKMLKNKMSMLSAYLHVLCQMYKQVIQLGDIFCLLPKIQCLLPLFLHSALCPASVTAGSASVQTYSCLLIYWMIHYCIIQLIITHILEELSGKVLQCFCKWLNTGCLSSLL